MTRFGMGYDVHRLVEGRKLILGGVDVPYEKGLLGHSDADVLLHAVSDAILGAAALGDIGTHFPDTDERFKGADSGKPRHRSCCRIFLGCERILRVCSAWRSVMSMSRRQRRSGSGSRAAVKGCLPMPLRA